MKYFKVIFDKIRDIISLSPLQAKGVYLLLGIALIVAITVKVIIQNRSLRMLYPIGQPIAEPRHDLNELPSINDK